MENEILIEYKIDNKQGLRLRRADVETLLFLFEEKVLSQKQLYRFYSLFVQQGIHYDSFKKRISKFIRLGLIKNYKYIVKNKRHGVRMNMLQLTEKGHWLLVTANFLKSDFTEITNNRLDRTLASKEILLHFLEEQSQNKGYFISAATQNLYLTTKYTELIDGFIASSYLKSVDQPIKIHANQYPTLFVNSKPLIDVSNLNNGLFFNIEQKSFNSVSISDGVLVVDQHPILVEIDFGHKTIIKNTELNRGSEEEAAKVPKVQERILSLVNDISNSDEATILYVYVDDAILFRRYYGEKNNRIHTFKKHFIDVLDNEEKSNFIGKDKQTNLFVCSLSRSENVTGTILKYIRGELLEERLIDKTFIAFHQFIEQVEAKQKQFTNIQHVKPLNDGQDLIIFKELNIKHVFHLKQTEYIDAFFIPLVMYEGNFQCQQQLHFLSQQFKKNKEKLGLPKESRILAIYHNAESMEHDICRDDIEFEEVIFCNLEELDKQNIYKILFFNLIGEEATLGDDII